jgi:hypothetical protein
LFFESRDHVLKLWEILERREEIEAAPERELVELFGRFGGDSEQWAGWRLVWLSDMLELEVRWEESWRVMVFILVVGWVVGIVCWSDGLCGESIGEGVLLSIDVAWCS